MNQKLPLPFLLIFLMLGVVSAGTVSITGTCQGNLQAGNILNFTLINTGNDTAYSLLLSPYIAGAQPENSTYPISSLPPNVNVATLVKLTNISLSGTYSDYFILTYQQGTSAFTALFPCLVNIQKATTSGIYLTITNTTASKGIATVNVSVFNGVRDSFTANITALLPPSFTFLSQKSYTLNIGPYQTKNLQFRVSYPQGQANYAGAISSSYVAQNLSYSSFVTMAINTQPASQGSPINYALWGGVGLAIVIIILIGRSVLKNKKKAE